MTRDTLNGFLCCLVGTDQYALRGSDVTLVARAELMRPGAERDGRVGTLASRGSEIPVYALAALLGGPLDARTADRYVIVTGGERDPYGLLVDRILRAATAGDLLPLSPVVGGSAVRWFRGVVTVADTSCLVLAPDGLRGGEAARGPAAPAAPVRDRAAALDAGLFLAFSSLALPPAASWSASRYAVSAARVAAVVQSMPLIAVPGCESQIAGVGIWRRTVVAVLERGGGAFGGSPARRFLILQGKGGALVAIAVGADTALRRASPEDRGGVPSTQTPGEVPPYVRGVFTSGGEAVALLDLESLV